MALLLSICKVRKIADASETPIEDLMISLNFWTVSILETRSLLMRIRKTSLQMAAFAKISEVRFMMVAVVRRLFMPLNVLSSSLSLSECFSILNLVELCLLDRVELRVGWFAELFRSIDIVAVS